MPSTFYKTYLFISFIFFCPLSSVAFPSSLVEHHSIQTEELISIAKEKNLAQSKQWLRLLHYNQGGSLHSRKKSYATSLKFFLSEKGNADPQQELEENIRQFFGDNIKQRCIFPARFHWLSEQLELEKYTLGLTHCAEFLKIQQQISAKKITLIFPSAYLNSPSSIFGHTLLRIDTSDNDDAVILNWAINYGATIDTNDGAIKYALKGVTGSYNGQYFIVPYSQKIKEYGQMENRDIWEYPLALSQSEVTFLTEHLWELKDINFDYFFFDENCSYRLLELLEVARPEIDLTSQLRLTEIPINTVKTLNKNKLIEASVFRPSKERLLNKHFNSLDKKEKKLSKALSKDEAIIHGHEFQSLNTQKQLDVLKTAYAYLRFQQSQEKRDNEIAKRSLILLQNINSISLDHNFQLELNKSETSDSLNNDGDIRQSHNSHRLYLNSGKLIDGKNYQSLQYRMAYHDLLDNSEGFFEGAHVEGPSFTIKQSESKSFIDQVTLFDIVSLNPRSDIRHDFSWNLGLKAERSEENNSHLHSIIYGGGGFAWEINNFLFYQLTSPRLEFSPNFDSHVEPGVEAKLGVIHNNGKHPRLLELKALKVNEQNVKYFAELSQQIELARNHALRVKVTYFEQVILNSELEKKQVELAYLFYF